MQLYFSTLVFSIEAERDVSCLGFAFAAFVPQIQFVFLSFSSNSFILKSQRFSSWWFCCVNWSNLSLTHCSLCDICSSDSCCLCCSCLSLPPWSFCHICSSNSCSLRSDLTICHWIFCDLYFQILGNLWPSRLQVVVIFAPLFQLAWYLQEHYAIAFPMIIYS